MEIVRLTCFTLLLLSANLIALTSSQSEHSAVPGSCASERDLLCPTNPALVGKFIEKFKQILNSTEELLQVFDDSMFPEEASQVYYQSWQEALSKAGVSAPESVAKELADALRVTYGSMTQMELVDNILSAVSDYLVDLSSLTADNAFEYAEAFAKVILKNFPADVSALDLTRSLAYGINDFLVPLGIYTPERAPALTITIAKEFYSGTGVKEFDDKLILGKIPRASFVYGLYLFSDTFTNSMAASTTLRNIFYLNESVSEISKAWYDVLFNEAKILNAYNPDYFAKTFSTTILKTFHYMSPIQYASGFVRGYAIHLLSHGYLNSSTSVGLSQELSNAMIELSKDIQPNSGLQTKFEVIFKAFRRISDTRKNLSYTDKQFQAILRYIRNEFLASTGIKRTRY